MPVTIKTSEMSYKDNLGNYHGINAIAEKKIADQIDDLDAAIAAQESRIATDISTMQAAADNIESERQTMIASIASVAGQGTDTTLTQSGVAADAKSAGDKISDLKSALGTTNNVLQLNDLTPINWYKEKDCGVKSTDGSDVTSSSFSATNYIDIRDFDMLTYKMHQVTGSSINTGIAFYTDDLVYIQGKVGEKNAASSGVKDYNIAVPSNAAYIRCTIWRDQTVGAFSISGRSKLMVQLDEINTKSDFNPFLAADTLQAIPFIAKKEASINYSDGSQITSSIFVATEYTDVEAYNMLYYKRVCSTLSSVNFGIALYDKDRNYLYGVTATSSADSNSYEYNVIYLSNNVKYVRATAFKDTATYGEFSIMGSPKVYDIVEDTENLWEFGDVNVNGGKGYAAYPLHLSAGTYRIKLTNNGKYHDDGMRIQFFGTKNIGMLVTEDRKANVSAQFNSTIEKTFTLASESNSVAFLAGPSASSASGKYLFCYDIEIVPSTNTKAYNPPLSAIDYRLSENVGLSDVVDYSTNFVLNAYIDTSGITADINSPVDKSSSSNKFGYCVVPCMEGDIFRVMAYGQSSLRTWAVIKQDGTVIAVSNPYEGKEENKILKPVDIKIPVNGAYLVVNHFYVGGYNAGYKPIVIKLTNNNAVNQIAEQKHIAPSIIHPEWKMQIVSCYEKYLVKNENGVLSRSNDCGITWGEGLDVSAVGLIKSYHMYANGCLGFFTQTKAYYTEDFTSYSEASCYEADGTTAYVPAELENFYTIFDVAERQFINGQDIYVFGNYVVNGANTTPPTRKLLWYSIDNGHSYKIAYEFGLQDTIPIRHVHSVVYYSPENVHIVTTGDTNATQCWVLGFTYDDVNDSWSVVKYNQSSSRNYKWAGLAIYGDELFFTFDNTPGELRKCKFADIGDYTKHETVLSGTTADAVGLIIGKRGDIAVMLSHSRSDGSGSHTYALSADKDCRTIYYSSDRKNWSKIFFDPVIADSYSVPSGFLPVTADGHIICGVHGGGGTTNWGKLPSIYLDECLKLAGFNDAFKPI